MIIVLVIAVIVVVVASGSRTAPTPATTGAVKVSPGESLWSIAAANPVEGLTTPETVEVIRRSNHLTSDAITTGSVLRVPATSASGVALGR